MNHKIFIVINSVWAIYNFRSGLLKSLVENGYDVTVIAPRDSYVSEIEKWNCRFIHIKMNQYKTNIFSEVSLLVRLFFFMLREKPNIILSYTIKPNIYSSIIARILNIPIINNITGLGVVFLKKGYLRIIVKMLYKIALSKSNKVFFQNIADKKLLESLGLVSPAQGETLPGSGVNISKFAPTSKPHSDTTRFLLVARMLRSKGILEFVNATKLLLQRGHDIHCSLLGKFDPFANDSISKRDLDSLSGKNGLHYLGETDNVAAEIAAVDCVVLPSYYPEGTPKSLLEAAAMARPIITTDTPGCRDVVEDGITGHLCKPRDYFDLANKMELIILSTKEEKDNMGRAGRSKIEREYDENIVVNRYLDAIQSMLVQE